MGSVPQNPDPLQAKYDSLRQQAQSQVSQGSAAPAPSPASQSAEKAYAAKLTDSGNHPMFADAHKQTLSYWKSFRAAYEKKGKQDQNG